MVSAPIGSGRSTRRSEILGSGAAGGRALDSTVAQQAVIWVTRRSRSLGIAEFPGTTGARRQRDPEVIKFVE